MLTPDEAFDPMREVEINAAIEEKIDNFLQKMFWDGNPQEVKFILGYSISQETARDIMSKYKRGGWIIRWDGDTNNPYFYFKLPPSRKPKRWYAPWR